MISVRCRPVVKNPSIIYKRADQVNQVDELFIESSPNITMTVRLLVVQNTSCSSGTYCNNNSWYLLLFEDSVPLLFWELTYSVMFSPDQETWFITWCEIIWRETLPIKPFTFVATETKEIFQNIFMSLNFRLPDFGSNIATSCCPQRTHSTLVRGM